MNFLIILNIFIIFLSYVSAQGKVCDKNSITTVSGIARNNEPICSGEIIFQDNFDSDNLNNWNHEQTMSGGGNNEFQWYTDSRNNSYTGNGKLHIRPTLTGVINSESFLTTGTINIDRSICTESYNDGCYRQGNSTHILPPVISARLKSKLNFKYGHVVVKAKLPSGDWLWPAIWLMPSKQKYGNAAKSGEMDVMESRGNTDYLTVGGGQVGVQQVTATLHFGDAPPNLESIGNYSDLPEGYDKDYHDYEVKWTPQSIQFLVDGKNYNEITTPNDGFSSNPRVTKELRDQWKNGGKNAPFDEEFYIILNTAVGGNSYFPSEFKNKNGKPWNDNEGRESATSFWKGRAQWLPSWDNNYGGKSEFLIDSVTVYAL